VKRALRRRYGRALSSSAVRAAHLELVGRTPSAAHQAIDLDTAMKWAARSVAAEALYERTRSPAWHDAAVEFAHEAREHAASGPPGSLEKINRILSK
jgi:hypothetical protein